MPRALILGSGGLLGSALRQVFSVTHEVVGLSRQILDVTDSTAVEKMVTDINPDIIINAVAYNGVDNTERDAQACAVAQKINADLVVQLARLANKLKIPLVHFSTDYVFAGNQGGYTEETAPAPVNKYGATKARGEALLKENTSQYYLVRLSRLFGPPGASPNAKKSFVDLIIDAVEKDGKKELKLVNEEISCPTYSLDAARFAHQIILDNAPYGIYHGANSGACSWYDLGKEVFAIKKINITVAPILSQDYPRPARRPLFSELINTKRPPGRPWQEALRDYLAR